MKKWIVMAALGTTVATLAKDAPFTSVTRRAYPACQLTDKTADAPKLAVIMKGTYKDDVRVLNYSGDSCFNWADERRSLAMYVALCYEEIDCSACENSDNVDADASYIVLVNAKNEEVDVIAFSDYFIDYQLICTAYANGKKDGAVAVTIGLPFEEIVLTGTRDCKYGLKQLTGRSVFNSYENDCSGELGHAKINLRRDDKLTKALYGGNSQYCPTCTPHPCVNLPEVLWTALEARYQWLVRRLPPPLPTPIPTAEE